LQKTEVEVEDMVRDAFDRVDGIHDHVHGGPNSPNDNAGAQHEDAAVMEDTNMDELLRESTQSLYEGCAVN